MVFTSIKSTIGIFISCSVLWLTACKNDEKNPKPEQPNAKTAQVESKLSNPSKPIDTLKMDNGIVIAWHEHGNGEPVKYSDVVNIDYKVRLDNGEVIDGNHLLNKPFFPFMVGFEMQTKGWDIALQKLRVGDFATVFIPANLARGDKEVKGLFPKNADNILTIHVMEKAKPNREIDGNKVWIFEENTENKLKFGENTTIQFHAIVSSTSTPYYFNSFQTGRAITTKLQDAGLVPGLKKALINAKKADRMFVFVPAREAYGDKGYVDFVKPKDDLFYNIFVTDVIDN